MLTLNRLAATAVLCLAPAAVARADDAGASAGLLTLQATARVAASLAEGDYCAARELRAQIEATLARLAIEPSQSSLVTETIVLLSAIRYDETPCEQPCPATGSAPAAADETLAGYTAALDAVVSRWLERAESDPPVVRIDTARHSYDPLPLYAPGAPVNYEFHVGAACHGAVIMLDVETELPASMDGRSAFVPDREGLWSIYIRRNDGVPLSPLAYLDPETGLPTYYQDFWVGTEPPGRLGRGRISIWFSPQRQGQIGFQ